MSPMDPADFASLLEREPLSDQGTMNDAKGLIPLSMHKAATDALSSAAERIKSLEDVLVAIRARCHRGDKEGTPFSALADITRLVTETLDPCKPWCVLAEPGRKHEGACVPIEEDDRGE